MVGHLQSQNYFLECRVPATITQLSSWVHKNYSRLHYWGEGWLRDISQSSGKVLSIELLSGLGSRQHKCQLSVLVTSSLDKKYYRWLCRLAPFLYINIYYSTFDSAAIFRVNNTPIYRSKSSFLVQGWLLETGSCPSAVDDWYWFPTLCM